MELATRNLKFNGFNLPLNSFSLRAGNKNTKFGGKQCQPNLNSFRAITPNNEDGSFQWLLTSTGRPFVSEGDFAAGCCTTKLKRINRGNTFIVDWDIMRVNGYIDRRGSGF